MKLGMVLGGAVTAGLGAAMAIFLPPFLEKDAAEFAATSNAVFDADAAKSAKAGDKFVFTGTVTDDNQEFDKGIVIGTRSELVKASKSAKRRARKAKKQGTSTKSIKDKAKDEWQTVQEYTQVLHLDVENGGKATFMLDGPDIEGDYSVDVEGKNNGTDAHWQGIKRGDVVSVRGAIESLEPLAVEVTRGQSLFVGKSDSMLTTEAENHESVVKGTGYAGWGLTGIGGLVLLFGFFKD
jgi:hypothetical protein